MKDRVRKIMEHFQLSQKDFANSIGVAEATLSSMLRGRTEPSLKIIMAIHGSYPAVSIDWLLYGNGDMLTALDGPSAGKAANVASNGDLLTSGDGANSDATIGQNVGFGNADGPSLFDAPPVQLAQNGTRQRNLSNQTAPGADYNAAISGVQIAEVLSQLKKANENDKPLRRIKEIRVFYDDGTFEAFAPTSR